jgi:phosphoribosylanthranilate isomerase
MPGRRLFVKICGITSARDALVTAESGADAVGFVFWRRSPRYVDARAARRMAEALPASILRVGVFVDAAPRALATAVERAGLDVLQLHGNEAPDALQGLPRTVWKAVRVGAGFAPVEALRYEGKAAGILLDTAAVVPGGSGQAFDWSLAREVRKRASFLILAGGLTPANVARAIDAVRPDAVDVSSGVESAPGRKDPAKVRAFVEAVRRAS